MKKLVISTTAQSEGEPIFAMSKVYVRKANTLLCGGFYNDDFWICALLNQR